MKENWIFIGFIVLAGLLIMFNMIGRLTEKKVWGEPVPFPVPENVKFDSSLPKVEDFCLTNDCKG